MSYCARALFFLLIQGSVYAAPSWLVTPVLKKDLPIAQTTKSYFYLTLPLPGHHKYDGGRLASFFVPLKQGGKHNVWWDTGSVLWGSSTGYRYTPSSLYFNQYWFAGIYFAYDFYDTQVSYNPLTALCRLNGGLEWGGSRLGQLTLNIYGVLGLTTDRLQNLQDAIQTVDHVGGSLKWVSVPHASTAQASIVLAYSKVQRRQMNNTFVSDEILRLGTGVQYALSDWIHFDLQYMWIDKDQPGFNIGIKIEDTHTRKQKDRFQGRLCRPPARHIPFYYTENQTTHSSVMSDDATLCDSPKGLTPRDSFASTVNSSEVPLTPSSTSGKTTRNSTNKNFKPEIQSKDSTTRYNKKADLGNNDTKRAKSRARYKRVSVEDEEINSSVPNRQGKHFQSTVDKEDNSTLRPSKGYSINIGGKGSEHFTEDFSDQLKPSATMPKPTATPSAKETNAKPVHTTTSTQKESKTTNTSFFNASKASQPDKSQSSQGDPGTTVNQEDGSTLRPSKGYSINIGGKGSEHFTEDFSDQLKPSATMPKPTVTPLTTETKPKPMYTTTTSTREEPKTSNTSSSNAFSSQQRAYNFTDDKSPDPSTRKEKKFDDSESWRAFLNPNKPSSKPKTTPIQSTEPRILDFKEIEDINSNEYCEIYVCDKGVSYTSEAKKKPVQKSKRSIIVIFKSYQTASTQLTQDEAESKYMVFRATEDGLLFVRPTIPPSNPAPDCNNTSSTQSTEKEIPSSSRAEPDPELTPTVEFVNRVPDNLHKCYYDVYRYKKLIFSAWGGTDDIYVPLTTPKSRVKLFWQGYFTDANLPVEPQHSTYVLYCDENGRSYTRDSSAYIASSAARGAYQNMGGNQQSYSNTGGYSNPPHQGSYSFYGHNPFTDPFGNSSKNTQQEAPEDPLKTNQRQFGEVVGLTQAQVAATSMQDLKKLYRQNSLKYHPDKNSGKAEALDKFQTLSTTYEFLSNCENKPKS